MVQIQAISIYDNCVGGLLDRQVLENPKSFNTMEEMNNYKRELYKEKALEDDSPIGIYFDFKHLKGKKE